MQMFVGFRRNGTLNDSGITRNELFGHFRLSVCLSDAQ